MASTYDEASPQIYPHWLDALKSNVMLNCKHQTYLLFKQLDLSNIQQIQFALILNKEMKTLGAIEIRIGSKNGKLIGKLNIPTNHTNPFIELVTPIEKTNGFHDVYFVFTNPDDINQNVTLPVWFYFDNLLTGN